jgi:sodium/hydrogen antiporter
MQQEVFYLFLTTAGALLVVLSFFNHVVKEYISPPLVALAAGVLLGPAFLNYLNFLPETNPQFIVRELTRITLAVGIMGIAFRIKTEDFQAFWKSGIALMVLSMTLMWGTSSLIAFYILGLSFEASLLLGAILAPVDPITTSSILVSKLADKKIPPKIKTIMTLETGSNDSLAYIFVLMPILLITSASKTEAFWNLLYQIIFWEIIVAALIGIAAGYLLGKIFILSERKIEMGKIAVLIFGVALTIFTLSFSKFVGADGFIGIFLAGVVFNYLIAAGERIEEEEMQEVSNMLVTVPTFILVGMMLPWGQWRLIGLPLVLFVFSIILFRRLPALLLIKPLVRKLTNYRNATYLGWFGPIGIPTIFYALLASQYLNTNLYWTITSAVVFASVIIHGLTVAPFTSWYAAKKISKKLDIKRQKPLVKLPVHQ